MPTYGPLPSSAQQVGSSWSGPSSTRLLDGFNATSTANNVQTLTLDVYTFGFNIPSTEKIVSMTAHIWAWQTVSSEQRVAPRLYVGGAAVGSAAPYVAPSLVFSPVTDYAFSGDAAYWGVSALPTPAEINASNFGMRIINTSGAASPVGLVAVDLATWEITTIPAGGESMRLNQRPWRSP